MREQNYDVIIVGSGVAGVITALSLPKNYRVMLLTKKNLEDCNSYLAQGGISALLNKDDRGLYIDDTLRAGHYENKIEAVEVLVDESLDAIDTLLSYKVDFDKDENGLIMTKEGAHSISRIRYCKDQTGKHIMDALIIELKKRKNIDYYENTKCINLIIENNRCFGVVAQDEIRRFAIFAANTVLATGGVGGIFDNTTNFSHICGDAISLAINYDIKLKDMSYIQIHPTSYFENNNNRNFLISESVRGEGAILKNHKKERFTDELQARDIVSKAILEEMRKEGKKYEFIDFTKMKVDIVDRFPNIYNYIKDTGKDPLNELIPIVPAVHYTMGGIEVDLDGKTSVLNLYAVGEAACTGVHGKNRLASNSLLEAVVFGKRVAKNIINLKSNRTIKKIVSTDEINFDAMKVEIKRRIKEDEMFKVE